MGLSKKGILRILIPKKAFIAKSRNVNLTTFLLFKFLITLLLKRAY